MKLVRSEAVAWKPVEQEQASGCSIRELITHRDGAPTFAMRQFEVLPGGHTPLHTHPWEHEVFILSGVGQVEMASGSVSFRSGDAIFVPAGELHSFCNTGSDPLRFLCMIPVQEPCCK
ncbi:MAG: cupin domain-containing protein [Chthonomonadales bacterium]